MGSLYGGILFSFKKEKRIYIYNMIEFWKYYKKWNKLVIKDSVVGFYVCKVDKVLNF